MDDLALLLLDALFREDPALFATNLVAAGATDLAADFDAAGVLADFFDAVFVLASPSPMISVPASAAPVIAPAAAPVTTDVNTSAIASFARLRMPFRGVDRLRAAEGIFTVADFRDETGLAGFADLLAAVALLAAPFFVVAMISSRVTVEMN
ncbi:MAG: hypothetical protein ABIP75_02705 [Pyrinomonadaceae bacterium]